MSEDKLVSALAHGLTPVSVKKPIRTTVVSFGISLVSTLIVFKLLFSNSVNSLPGICEVRLVSYHSTFKQ